MAIGQLLGFFGAALALASRATAHGNPHQKPLTVPADAPWAVRHMAEEHHIADFDAGAFFQLHDYDGSGGWEAAEILKTYGFEDPSLANVGSEKRDEVLREVLDLLDGDGDGVVQRGEWEAFTSQGKTLPDFGLGPGHHWDMETEYEIHHWERYHDENTKMEDLVHPEDIEHFKKHDELEDEEARVAALDKLAIVEQNIPRKFRRD